MCCCNKEKRTKIHVKNVMMVLRGLKRENDSVKAIGSKDVGRAVRESNVMDSSSVVVSDTRLLRESRQMEIDFRESVGCVLQTSKAVGIFRWNDGNA